MQWSYGAYKVADSNSEQVVVRETIADPEGTPYASRCKILVAGRIEDHGKADNQEA